MHPPGLDSKNPSRALWARFVAEWQLAGVVNGTDSNNRTICWALPAQVRILQLSIFCTIMHEMKFFVLNLDCVKTSPMARVSLPDKAPGGHVLAPISSRGNAVDQTLQVVGIQ